MARGSRLLRLAELVPPDTLLERLNTVKPLAEEMILPTNGEEAVTLQTIIRDVRDESTFIRGELVYERPVPLRQIDGSVKYGKDAQSVSFVFYADSPFLVILANKEVSEKVAFKMNRMLFNGENMILKTYISEEVIQEFLHQNPHLILRIHWSNLRIPGINKAALAGSDVIRAPDPRRYDMHGERSYIVVRLLENGWAIGISRGGSIVFFKNTITDDEIIEFVRRKIISLME